MRRDRYGEPVEDDDQWGAGADPFWKGTDQGQPDITARSPHDFVDDGSGQSCERCGLLRHNARHPDSRSTHRDQP